MAEQTVIFTDLDGTLLDHRTYCFEAALPAVMHLRQCGVPIIFNTSKTRAELLPLREALALRQPFIVENGAAVYIPEGLFEKKTEYTSTSDGMWKYAFAPPRQHWLTLLDSLKKTFSGAFIHFAQMSTEDVVASTGLDWDAAVRAQQREYSEPVLWKGDAEHQHAFIRACKIGGARVLRGGRFLHVGGVSDKGVALRWLIEQYRSARQLDGGAVFARVRSVALGDSHNDVEMLNAADQAVIVRGVNSEALRGAVNNPELLYTEQWGPRGWREAMIRLELVPGSLAND
ncbi:MAG: HAD-IIB family hydrolase [Gammaproteobacteria bacterium]